MYIVLYAKENFKGKELMKARAYRLLDFAYEATKPHISLGTSQRYYLFSTSRERHINPDKRELPCDNVKKFTLLLALSAHDQNEIDLCIYNVIFVFRPCQSNSLPGVSQRAQLC